MARSHAKKSKARLLLADSPSPDDAGDRFYQGVAISLEVRNLTREPIQFVVRRLAAATIRSRFMIALSHVQQILGDTRLCAT